MSEENTVFIGKKPTMNYVLAVVTQFNGGVPNVIIKARGKSISKAVDVALIVGDRFVHDASVNSINIVTEQLKSEDGQMMKVSSIEINMAKSIA